MLVKCVAVPKERTAKKVEVILSRVSPSKKNVIKLNARIAAPALEEYEDIFSFDIAEGFDEVGDNLDGIVPIEEYYAEEHSEAAAEETEEVSAEEIFTLFSDSDEESDGAEVSIYDVDADLEELENDFRNQLGDVADDEYEADSEISDNSIVQRHFVRADDGALYESDSEDAEGHEVACYDNLGKLKRACGVIKKGQPLFQKEPDIDDVYSRAVADMFHNADE